MGNVFQFGIVHYFTKVGSGEYYLEELEDEPCPLVNIQKKFSLNQWHSYVILKVSTYPSQTALHIPKPKLFKNPKFWSWSKLFIYFRRLKPGRESGSSRRRRGSGAEVWPPAPTTTTPTTPWPSTTASTAWTITFSIIIQKLNILPTESRGKCFVMKKILKLKFIGNIDIWDNFKT